MTDFTTRLNQAMELRNIKQIDFVKAAQGTMESSWGAATSVNM